jgi:glycopeptide antibiotics resistance protein
MRELVIPKPITVVMLLIVTVVIATITLWMSGHSYKNFDPIPFEDLRYLADRLERRPIAMHVLALIVVPVIANVLLFVPWGFLMFITLYSVERPTIQTYILTFLTGLTLTLAIEAWQYFIPSRVADINDVIWNATGTVLGAFLGHARLRVRFEFD